MWCRWLRHALQASRSRVRHPLGSLGRSMAMGSIQTLTEMSTRDISLRVKMAGAEADNLNTFMFLTVTKSGCLKLLVPKGTVQACNGIAYILKLGLIIRNQVCAWMYVCPLSMCSSACLGVLGWPEPS